MLEGSRPDTKSVRKQKLRDTHKRWLQELSAQTGMTLTALARLGDLDPSALTRFMNDEKRGSTLDSLTIATLTERTGIAPEPSADGKPQGMREPEATAFQHAADDPFASVVAAMLAGKPNLFAWELRSNALIYEGYMPGDILIVDLNAEPVAGRVVCAQIYDWNNRNGTETVFRLYQPPFLLASGPTPEARTPRLLSDTGSVAIKGMVIATLRPR